MPRADWERFRPAVVIGGREYGYRSVGSTMDVAWELAEAGAAHGTCVVAGTQTRGRGRFDRKWVSGDSLLASVVLRPGPAIAPMLTVIGCLAVVDAVGELCGLPCAIKWPNDVHIGGRKLCGVLAEGRIHTTGTGGAAGVAVLGIGLNVNLDVAEHPELAGIATSLLAETGSAIDLRSAGDTLFRSLEARYDGADPAALLAHWREAMDTLGRRVSVTVRGQSATLSGLAEDVDAAGRLLLRTDDGVLHALDEGDVTLSG